MATRRIDIPGARLAPTLVVVGALSALVGCGGPEMEAETKTYAITPAVEQWRELVEKYFKYQHVTWALNIIQCESGGDPNAYNKSSGASGLFQHLAKYWAARAAAAGFAGYSAFHPEANIAASAYLLYAPGGGPQHWSCKFSPYEDFNYKPKYYKDGVPVAPPAPCPTLPTNGGVIDEGGPCFELHGPSQYWRSVSGQGHDGGLRWTNAVQQSSASNWARWQIKLKTAGKYTVKYYAVEAYAVFKATRYQVRHAGKETTLTVDQSAGGTGWRTLGTYSFAQGGDQHLSVYDNTSQPVAKDQHIIADAIKLVPFTNPPPPPPPPPPADEDGGVEPPPSSAEDGGVEPPEADGELPSPDTEPGGQLPDPYDPGNYDVSDPGDLTGGCTVSPAMDTHAWPLFPLLLLACWIWLLRRRTGQRALPTSSGLETRPR